jgi:hypothetical protein
VLADACPRCATALDGAARFCTTCGAPRGRPAVGDQPPVARVGVVEPPFVHCAACEAPNAASRSRCARCGAGLSAVSPGTAAETSAAVPAAAAGSPAAEGGARVFTGAAVLAAVAIVAALGALLWLRGSERLDPVVGVPGPEPAPVSGATASTTPPATATATFEPANLLDGDHRTAWVAAAEDGQGEAGQWVELALAEPVAVSRIVVWNGYQAAERFAEYGRVTQVRLELGAERLTADVLDLEGPQAIDLPEPIETDRLRLELLEVVPGARFDSAALSRVDVVAAEP